MAKTISENAKDFGQAVVDGAKKVASEVANGTARAAENISNAISGEGPDLGIAGIREHMDVIASCGKKVGVVDNVNGNLIKLTRKDSADNQHHYVPLDWVARVDRHVHLNRNSKETELSWKMDSDTCDC